MFNSYFDITRGYKHRVSPGYTGTWSDDEDEFSRGFPKEWLGESLIFLETSTSAGIVFIWGKWRFSGWWLSHPSEKYWSTGIVIPNIWKNKKCSKPPTRRSLKRVYLDMSYRSVLWGLVCCVVLYCSSMLGMSPRTCDEAATRPLQGKIAYLWPAMPPSFRESPRRKCKPRTSTWAAGIHMMLAAGWSNPNQQYTRISFYSPSLTKKRRNPKSEAQTHIGLDLQ